MSEPRKGVVSRIAKAPKFPYEPRKHLCFCECVCSIETTAFVCPACKAGRHSAGR